ncbi:hypothetical protein [Neptuniibacter sp.]|uniref:hypothetical protein n=1 Tax=Neptuniibacter sp. TaxID=1962643 RepID=UPI00260A1F20|nr:hypothetical protein [Neptuniibacter sp.]MCP4595329.1 hypothetical protein [Neptuniibacter sp.]
MKDRQLIYKVILKENTEIAWNKAEETLEFRNSSGELSSKNQISIGAGYTREGKQPKILRETNHPGGTVSFTPKETVYDRYLAIDTSHEKFGENLICVTACLSIEQDIDSSGELKKGESISILQWPRLVFLTNDKFNPERYGWFRFIEALEKSDGFSKERTYGVIVDSDLDRLPDINYRAESVFEEYYLPECLSLIYASADTGMENMKNKLIKQTDKVAAITLKQAQKEFASFENYDLEADIHVLGCPNDPIKVHF